MEKIIVSACILGDKTRYDGKSKKFLSEKLEKWISEGRVVKICPEVMGGLGVPRAKSEISGEKVINEKGLDVTKNFYDGAEKSLEIAKKNNITKAILKQASPSCGTKEIYDGSFSGVKISGMGICARLFYENGIEIYDETEIDKITLE